MCWKTRLECLHLVLTLWCLQSLIQYRKKTNYFTSKLASFFLWLIFTLVHKGNIKDALKMSTISVRNIQHASVVFGGRDFLMQMQDIFLIYLLLSLKKKKTKKTCPRFYKSNPFMTLILTLIRKYFEDEYIQTFFFISSGLTRQDKICLAIK